MRQRELESVADDVDGVEIYIAQSVEAFSDVEMARFPKGSVTVQAGAAVRRRIPATFHDDTGENISGKNKSYGELTVTYWAWKNRRAQVKGISRAHRCIALTEKEREGLLTGKVDAILPLPRLCYPDTGMEYGEYISDEVLEAMLEAVETVHGKEMRKCAGEKLRGDLLYRCNILVAREEVFDDYCAWMFPVLEEAEARIRESVLREEHICAHLGELLGTIYFLAVMQGRKTAHEKQVWLA